MLLPNRSGRERKGGELVCNSRNLKKKICIFAEEKNKGGFLARNIVSQFENYKNEFGGIAKGRRGTLVKHRR